MKNKKQIDVFAFVNAYAARIYGQDLKTHHSDVNASFHAQILARKLHGYNDTPTFGWADWGAWEFGGDIRWPETYAEGYPSTLRHPVEKPSDIDRLAIPDPKYAGSYALLWEFNRLLAKHGFKPRLRAGSVTSVVAGMIGIDHLLRWFFKEPTAVHAAFEKATQLILMAAEYALEEFGPHCSVSISAPIDSNSLISPAIFKKFALPYHQRIISEVCRLGFNSIRLHLCGDHSGNLSAWAGLPWPKDTLISIGSEMGITATANAFGHRFKVGGNVSTTLLGVGTYDEVYQAATRCIEEGQTLPAGFALMPACEMPVSTPPLNVQALVDACRDYNQREGG
jgi:uroporphyrinogen decarboxylase